MEVSRKHNTSVTVTDKNESPTAAFKGARENMATAGDIHINRDSIQAYESR